jgi:hypothetical protein
MSQTRRLTAILDADMAGYSRLMGADEEGTLECLKALRRQLVDPKIAEHRGRIASIIRLRTPRQRQPPRGWRLCSTTWFPARMPFGAYHDENDTSGNPWGGGREQGDKT